MIQHLEPGSGPDSLPDLRGALVRSWDYDGRTFSWSLLVPCETHGYQPLTLVYTDAVLRRGGLVLDEVPMVAGRTYVVQQHRLDDPPGAGAGEDGTATCAGAGHGADHGGVHHVAFWPTPQFRVHYGALRWERGARPGS